MSDTYSNTGSVLTANFSTAAGNSPFLQVPAGESVSISLSGTYAATVQFEQATTGAQTAVQVIAGPYSTANASVAFTYTAPGGPEAFTYIRFNCTAYTSGTAVATATPMAKQTITLEDKNGAPILTGSPAGITVAPSVTFLGGVTAAPFNPTASTQVAVAGTINQLGTAAGTTSTLPAATGSGKVYKFLVSLVATSNAHVVTASAATATFVGALGSTVASSGATNTYVPTAGASGTGSDTITLAPATTGGYSIGDYFEVVDVAANVYQVHGVLSVGAGSQATPFSTVA